MTQERLAELMGMTVQAVSNIERGQSAPTVRTLQLLSRHLNVPIQELFYQEPVEPEPTGRNPARQELEARMQKLTGLLSIKGLRIAARLMEALAQFHRRRN